MKIAVRPRCWGNGEMGENLAVPQAQKTAPWECAPREKAGLADKKDRADEGEIFLIPRSL